MSHLSMSLACVITEHALTIWPESVAKKPQPQNSITSTATACCEPELCLAQAVQMFGQAADNLHETPDPRRCAQTLPQSNMLTLLIPKQQVKTPNEKQVSASIRVIPGHPYLQATAQWQPGSKPGWAHLGPAQQLQQGCSHWAASHAQTPPQT